MSELSPTSLMMLMQLASPALPVGGFSYSEGLEAAVEHGLVHDEASAQTWLIDQLLLVQARSDLAVLAQAMAAWAQPDVPRLQQLNDWLLQTRETHEMRLQTEQMGRSLVDWLRNQAQADAARLSICAALPPTWPLIATALWSWLSCSETRSKRLGVVDTPAPCILMR